MFQRAVLDDVGRVEMLEGRDQLQFHLAEHPAEGRQHVRAESQAEGIGRHAAHALDHQRNRQPDAQEEKLEDRQADHQEHQGGPSRTLRPPLYMAMRSSEPPTRPGW